MFFSNNNFIRKKSTDAKNLEKYSELKLSKIMFKINFTQKKRVLVVKPQKINMLSLYVCLNAEWLILVNYAFLHGQLPFM